MRRVELKLTHQDRATVAAFRRKGQHPSREVNRAHILASVDAGLPIQQITTVLGVTRVSVWRTCATYLQHGLEKALFDEVRAPTGKQEAGKARQAAPQGIDMGQMAAAHANLHALPAGTLPAGAMAH